MVKPHDQLQIMLADVIAMLEDVKATQGVCLIGRCYSHLWLMELPLVSIYFNLSSEMLSRTSSQICDRQYLPMFLFRDGLFTLIYRASLMSLMGFWSSLPNMEKLSIVTRDVNMPTFIYDTRTIHVPTPDMPLKYHKCQLFRVLI